MSATDPRQILASFRLFTLHADLQAGRDTTWAQTDPNVGVRRVAAYFGRDTAWARQDPDPSVRRAAAFADRRTGRDTTWARRDSDASVRQVAEGC